MTDSSNPTSRNRGHIRAANEPGAIQKDSEQPMGDEHRVVVVAVSGRLVLDVQADWFPRDVEVALWRNSVDDPTGRHPTPGLNRINPEINLHESLSSIRPTNASVGCAPETSTSLFTIVAGTPEMPICCASL
jgi:hypothetical protein